MANIEENTSVGAINKNGGFHLNKKNNNQNSEVAGRMFDPSDYEKKTNFLLAWQLLMNKLLIHIQKEKLAL